MYTFLNDETGAVTVDWVVLTAALVGLGLAVMGVVSTGAQTQSTAITSQMEDGTIIRTRFTGAAGASRDSACSSFGGCDDSLSASALKSMSNADLANVQNVTYGDDAAAGLTGAGYSQDADGNWGQNDADGNFVVDQAATDNYNTANNAQTAQNGLIQAERDARAN